MNTELFLYLCKRVDLHSDDLEIMTIGMCLDYIEEWIENNKSNNDNKQSKGRKGTQADFDNF